MNIHNTIINFFFWGWIFIIFYSITLLEPQPQVIINLQNFFIKEYDILQNSYKFFNENLATFIWIFPKMVIFMIDGYAAFLVDILNLIIKFLQKIFACGDDAIFCELFQAILLSILKVLIIKVKWYFTQIILFITIVASFIYLFAKILYMYAIPAFFISLHNFLMIFLSGVAIVCSFILLALFIHTCYLFGIMIFTIYTNIVDWYIKKFK